MVSCTLMYVNNALKKLLRGVDNHRFQRAKRCLSSPVLHVRYLHVAKTFRILLWKSKLKEKNNKCLLTT